VILKAKRSKSVRVRSSAAKMGATTYEEWGGVVSVVVQPEGRGMTKEQIAARANELLGVKK